MPGDFLVLAVNPGSSSTKVGLFRGAQPVFQETLYHPAQQLACYARVVDQEEFRLSAVQELVQAKIQGLAAAAQPGDAPIPALAAVVGRGGLLRPVPGGTYAVDEAMLADLRAAVGGEHASNLGGILACRLACWWQRHAGRPVPAFVVDPVAVDEMAPVARITGWPGMLRRGRCHALNMRAVAREVAARHGRRYEDLALVVAHLGTGISLAAHLNGRMVDVSDPNAEGPFSVDRCGGLPADRLVDMCEQHGTAAVRRRLIHEGGMFAYFRTRDMRHVVAMAREGDARARLLLDAMAYQVAKAIGGLVAALGRPADFIILTGALAHARELVEAIGQRVRFLSVAPLEVVPGERELEALALGALRVLQGQEVARDYAAEARRMEEQLADFSRRLAESGPPEHTSPGRMIP
ncbi:MAG: butyrate kinase [Firmicutes bacterium]|nr:butyrate kinase [Bacillota bacterium]